MVTRVNETVAYNTKHNVLQRNGVLVTMTSEDIVRKAKALADTYADSWKKNKAGNDEEYVIYSCVT